MSPTKEQWLQKVKDNKEALLDLVETYHPSLMARRLKRPDMIITAPGAEAACSRVREAIAQKEPDVDPTEQFTAALTNGDVSKLISLLDKAWFGMPESTGCWSVRGFKEAVDLLDDPPEEES